MCERTSASQDSQSVDAPLRLPVTPAGGLCCVPTSTARSWCPYSDSTIGRYFTPTAPTSKCRPVRSCRSRTSRVTTPPTIPDSQRPGSGKHPRHRRIGRRCRRRRSSGDSPVDRRPQDTTDPGHCRGHQMRHQRRGVEKSPGKALSSRSPMTFMECPSQISRRQRSPGMPRAL